MQIATGPANQRLTINTTSVDYHGENVLTDFVKPDPKATRWASEPPVRPDASRSRRRDAPSASAECILWPRGLRGRRYAYVAIGRVAGEALLVSDSGSRVKFFDLWFEGKNSSALFSLLCCCFTTDADSDSSLPCRVSTQWRFKWDDVSHRCAEEVPQVHTQVDLQRYQRCQISDGPPWSI